jgi:4-hydroxy-tetrahydrodipicolinate synthase
VADNRLRVYLYHIPPVSQVGIGLALIDRLMKHFPGIVAGIKDSSGEWENTSRLLKEFQPRGLDVFAGNETVLLRTMEGGGAGCITATGNVNPAPIVHLYEQWKHAGAADQQRRLNETRDAFQSFPIIAAMKSAVAWKSGDAGWAGVRSPLVELSASQSVLLRTRLEELRFEMPNARQLSISSDETFVMTPAELAEIKEQ